ncbi:MAG TPA: FtsX-like permease family protein [Candidatus Saccharimonadales bacterium]|nr:FtsX-like permease family protein [Candidatus Saccharimonadales bacterium]
MRFADYIRLALRNITRQKLRSALTIFAVVIGATSVTIMLALVFSVKGFMTKQFEANGTLQQVRVSPQTDITWQDNGGGGSSCADCVKLTDTLTDKINSVPHVAGSTRILQIGAFQALTYGSQKLRLYQVQAYDANGILTNNVLAGRDILPSDKAGVIVLTADYADKFGFKGKYQSLVGKQVGLLAQNWYNGVGSDPLRLYQEQQDFFATHPGADGRDFQPTPTTLTARVVGVIDTSQNSYAARVPLEWARGMDEAQSYQVTQADQDAAQATCRNSRAPCNSQPQPSLVVTDEVAKNGYDSLIVKVDKATNAAAAATQIKKFGVGAVDAQTYIKSQLAIFNIVGAVLGGIGGISLAVAAVGVVNTMVMAILERTREIGVMRAVGAKRRTVSRLFTFEAALLGFLGGVFGVLVGYGLTLIANPIINRQLKGNGIKSSNIITLPLWLIVTVIAVTTIIGMLAGLYPARRAAKLDPVEALRYE